MSITTTTTTHSCMESLVLMHHLLPPSSPFLHKQTDQIKAAEPQTAYIQPLSNYSLTTKSLDMCTESLGNETGSATTDELPIIQKKAPPPPKAIKKVKRSGASTFPPPLTSMSGSGRGGVRMQTHREGGRLLVKAFTVSSCNCCHFKAERRDGRLRLSLSRDDGEEEEGDRDGGRVGCVIGGGEWSSSRCNGDRSSREKLHSLPFCVAIS